MIVNAREEILLEAETVCSKKSIVEIFNAGCDLNLPWHIYVYVQRPIFDKIPHFCSSTMTIKNVFR